MPNMLRERVIQKTNLCLRTAALNRAKIVLELSTSQVGDGTKDSEGCSLAVGVTEQITIGFKWIG